jgi:hypothetical protein
MGTGHWWGLVFQVIYLGFVGGFAVTAFSRRRFEVTCAAYPGTTRPTWVFNYGLFFVVLPLVVWLIFGLPSLLLTFQ